MEIIEGVRTTGVVKERLVRDISRGIKKLKIRKHKKSLKGIRYIAHF